MRRPEELRGPVRMSSATVQLRPVRPLVRCGLRPLIKSQGGGVGYIELNQPAMGRQPHQEVAMLPGEPAQPRAFGAKHKGDAPAQIGVARGSVPSAARPRHQNPAFFSASKSLGDVGDPQEGHLFQPARSRFRQAAGFSRCVMAG